MKFILLLTFGISMVANANIRVFHYNIKELDSLKIEKKTTQINAVKKILAQHDIDILSLNEIQYDLPKVPNAHFKSTGQNLQKLMKQLGLSHLKYESFSPANTGLQATSRSDGTFYTQANTADARKHADQVNFGVFPAQYSTGALFKYKVIEEKVINDLKWKDFNPDLDLKKYKLANGKKIPEDIALFDKNFSDITLEIQGKKVHLILLHTVPSYGFGNKFSVNDFRNAEQLRFLEWYITGSTNRDIQLKNIRPLKQDSYYIALGDFNVSPTDKSSEGANVLKDIFSKSNLWVDEKELTFSNESDHYGPAPLKLMLDFIVTSKNIKKIKGSILHPKSLDRKEHGCSKRPDHAENGNVIREYTKNNKTCYVEISKEYDLFKQASDHYPLYGEFELL